MSPALALRADRIVTEAGIAHGSWLVLSDGRIERVSRTQPIGTAISLDLGDVTLIPGLIDIHIHGREGADVMDADPVSLRTIARSLARHGVTGFLATTVTADWNRTLAALGVVADMMHEVPSGARLLGAYSEGLFFSCTHRGAHNPDWFLKPDRDRIDALIAASRGALKVLALAPEIDGAMDSLRHAVARGLRVALGHTDASYDQTRAALAAGASSGVHLFNGMRGLHHREPGCAGALLMEDCFVEVIADGAHLHPAILQLIARLKSADQVMLISDCMCAGGMPNGTYRLGEMDVAVRDGVARTAAGGLAGSTLTIDRALARIIDATGIALEEAVHMASLTPARFLEIAQDTGSIAPGKRADLTVLDTAGDVRATLVGGQCAWLAPDFAAGEPLAQFAAPRPSIA
ncbi:N-acetylglucosamine-6-phosphate deacetylase [uncultured Sphingomonas sp.]|uniref:N-acetylglucosamine-6-phosphate deacetylase n=1 Tax=uncultured Sphingomonas sp. TaxID=158754 RepID=UPI0025D3062A|nr:N-acetylglucosamine-6-phosphate deacetylase [uncultured Sphingomonas sp.]